VSVASLRMSTLCVYVNRHVVIINSIFFYGAGVEPSPLLLRPFIGILNQPCKIDGDDCGKGNR
jgi:hypothetical protein